MPNMTGGSVERVEVNFANSAAKRGCTVFVVLLLASCEFLANLLSGVRVVDVNALRL